MGEGDAGAGGDQQAADPGRRRLVALRLGVEFRVLDQDLQRQEQQGGGAEAEQRREQQRPADLDRLRPVDAGGLVVGEKELVGETDADDRADQRMRGGGRQAKRPGAEIPDDRGDQQGEDHGEAGAGADIQDELDRQQRDDAEGDRARGKQHAEEVEESGPDHCDLRRHGMGIDHGRDRIGGVVEAVDEFEGERDQQSDAEQDEGQPGRRRHPGAADVLVERPDGVGEAGQHDRDEDQAGDHAARRIELRFSGSRLKALALIKRDAAHRDVPTTPLRYEGS